MKARYFHWLRWGWILLSLYFMGFASLKAQTSDRLLSIERLLDSMATQVPGLDQASTLSLRDVPVSEYVRAIGLQHGVNVYIAETPSQVLTSNLIDEPVKSIFLFICKNFDYQIQVTGTIFEFLPYLPPEALPESLSRKELKLEFQDGKLAVDLRRDSLSRVLAEISRLTGMKLLTRPGVEGLIDAFLPATPLDTALEAILSANGYKLQPRRKGYFLVETTQTAPQQASTGTPQAPAKGRQDFIVEAYTNGKSHFISLEAEDADLQSLVQEVFLAVGADYVIYEALEGTVTINAELARLSDALKYLFQATAYTFRQEGTLFMIGPKDLDGLQTIETVRLKYRPTFQAMELIPGADITYETAVANQPSPVANQLNQGSSVRYNQANLSSQNYNGVSNPYRNVGPGFSTGRASSLGHALPPTIVKTQVGKVELVDYPELNRIILKGPAEEVTEIKRFLQSIDQPVPMVKVEMIVVEVNKDRLVNTGLKAGLRAAIDSTAPSREILPGINYDFSGGELNDILGSIPQLSNLGVLNQNVYLQLRAQEERGNLKMKMRPVLSMLNGREASLVIGQTQYFLLETTTTSNGAVNSFQQFTQRFERIDANITLTLKPYISDDGMVTLDVLPDFTTPVGQFSSEVPPTISTRSFASTIRVKDGETVILGGLSEEANRENTSGLPWVSRVPVLKWFFSDVRKQKQSSSLIIYLTPVVYYH